MIFFISRKRYSIGEVLKRIFFRNPGIAKNMNFAKGEKGGGGGGGGGQRLIGRELLYGKI